MPQSKAYVVGFVDKVSKKTGKPFTIVRIAPSAFSPPCEEMLDLETTQRLRAAKAEPSIASPLVVDLEYELCGVADGDPKYGQFKIGAKIVNVNPATKAAA